MAAGTRFLIVFFLAVRHPRKEKKRKRRGGEEREEIGSGLPYTDDESEQRLNAQSFWQKKNKVES